VKNGLAARTKILSGLETRAGDAVAIARTAEMSYAAAMHHLRLLAAEGTVRRRGKRPYFWSLTGLGQKRLVS